MANEEHLAKLTKGVEAWNQWRKENSNIQPDLSSADLSSADLRDADLSSAILSSADLRNADLRYAYLSGAELSSAILSGADLESANLRYAYLSGAKLQNAYLKDANLRDADLRNADLSNADLSNAYFSNVNLSNVNLSNAYLESAKLGYVCLSGADLSSAYLKDANLYGAKLQNAYLRDTKLYGAKLYDANLRKANLSSAKLEEANLSSAELEEANLSSADLTRVQALATNFKDATLTGACIEDWNINSYTNLHNVKCNYIYLQYDRRDRRPHDPDKIFAPGEFTKRYQKILETVNLYFGEGIDWQVFLNSFQKLQEEEKIKITEGDREIPIVQGIENTGDGSFVIKIGVSPDTDKGEIEKSFWQKYQPMLEAAEERYQLQLNAKQEQIDIYRQQNTELLEIIKLKASQPINIQNTIQGDNKMTGEQNVQGNYYQTSGNVSIVHNEGIVSDNAKIVGEINEAAQQDLAQAAAEIQQLLDQLSQTYPTENPLEQMTVGVKLAEEIKNNPTRWQKVINVIKAMGIEALAEAVDNPIFNIAKAGIEATLESES